jgi:YihY family inner membrane protein
MPLRNEKPGQNGIRSRVRKIVILLLPSLRYLFTTEVHAYAFSIAANVYLSFFPFALILLSVCRRWLHWEGAYEIILGLLRVHLPAGTDSVVRNLIALVQGRPRLQAMSVFMLLFTASGVFLPLEVSLNKVWGIARNRSFLRNLLVSFALAIVAGVLALFWISMATMVQASLTFTLDWVPSPGFLHVVSRCLLETISIPFAVSIFFVIYFCLPNGRVPVERVLPAAVITGVLMTVARFLYVLTLPLFRFREVYGPFALSVTLLFWAFVGALIMLFGAHLSVQDFWDDFRVRRALRTRMKGPAESAGTSPNHGFRP